VGNSVAPDAKKAASAKKTSSPKVKNVRRIVANGRVTKISSASLKRGDIFRIVPKGAEYTAIAVSAGHELAKVDHPVLLAKGQTVISLPKSLYRVHSA
jgi:hypothetical protein